MPDKEDLVDFRLSNIEKTLVEMKDVMTETKLQANEIKAISDRQLEMLNAINSHDKRLRDLELSPAKSKAVKWDSVVDLVFKLGLTAAVGVVIAKVGL